MHEAGAWLRQDQRRADSSPCERNVRDRLFAFYDWCACNDDIPELVSLARTSVP